MAAPGGDGSHGAYTVVSAAPAKAVKRKRAVMEDEGRKVTPQPRYILINALNKGVELDEVNVGIVRDDVCDIANVSAIYTFLSDEHPTDPFATPSVVYRKVRLMQLIRAMAATSPHNIIRFTTLMCRMRDSDDEPTRQFCTNFRPVMRLVALLVRGKGDSRHVGLLRGKIDALTKKVCE